MNLMPRKPLARLRILQAFEHIVGREGERAATLDAVAAEAGVSKGGLLYHFGSRAALVRGAVERWRELVEEDVDVMRASPEGAARHFLQTSLWVGSELDIALGAANTLAQAGDETVRTALREVTDLWHECLLADVGNPDTATAVLLMGDGLYSHASGATLPDSQGARREILDALLRSLEHLPRAERAD